MANIIVLKHRSGSSGEPTGLQPGEIATNTLDKLIFIGTGSGNVIFADKAYVDNQLGGKADSSTIYTQTQIDTFLGNKANASEVYTQTQLDTFLANKANSADVYTQAEVDGLLNNLLDGAPGALDTLNELAQAIGDDANFAGTITAQIATKLSDAPSDGSQYSRQDGAWVKVVQFDITNATIDGGTY